jgi:hypothetical protein
MYTGMYLRNNPNNGNIDERLRKGFYRGNGNTNLELDKRDNQIFPLRFPWKACSPASFTVSRACSRDYGRKGPLHYKLSLHGGNNWLERSPLSGKGEVLTTQSLFYLRYLAL